jgi:hypothetical protein
MGVAPFHKDYTTKMGGVFQLFLASPSGEGFRTAPATLSKTEVPASKVA